MGDKKQDKEAPAKEQEKQNASPGSSATKRKQAPARTPTKPLPKWRSHFAQR